MESPQGLELRNHAERVAAELTVQRVHAQVLPDTESNDHRSENLKGKVIPELKIQFINETNHNGKYMKHIADWKRRLQATKVS